MSVPTLTLTDFLLARIAEDEATVHKLESAGGRAWAALPVGLLPIARWVPARVLAECEAKRRIVAMAEELSRRMFRPAFVGTVALEMATEAQAILRALALPYANHPDYRDEWRP